MTTRNGYICDLDSQIRLAEMYPESGTTARLLDFFSGLGFIEMPADENLDDVLWTLSDTSLVALGWIFGFTEFIGASRGGLSVDEDVPGEVHEQMLPEPDDAGWMAHRLDALADKAGW